MIRLNLCAVFFLAITSQASNLLADTPVKGRPFIQYYSPSDYGAGSNNFNTVRDSLGVFYFSNDEGVLTFDGSEWGLIPIKDNRPAYWVEINEDGSILVASTGEIGHLKHLPNGKKVYETLQESSPEIEFENVWEIAVTSRGAVFRSRKSLMYYQNGVVKTIGDRNDTFDVAFTVNDTVYVRIYGKGLFFVQNATLVPVAGGEFFANKKLNSYLPYEDKLLVGTRREGLFLVDNGTVTAFATEADDFFKKYRIYHGCVTQDGNYAYAAYIKGVAIIDKTGKLLQVLDEEVGLPKHQYLSVEPSDPASLWITHAVGISRAEILSPVSYFDQTFGLEDVVTDINIYNDNLYVTTLKEFYQYEAEQNNFVSVNSKYLHEFHGITVVGDQIYVGGQIGLMALKEDQLQRLTNKVIHKLSSSEDQKWIFAGSGEGGFDIIQKQNNEFKTTPLSGFTEQVKSIIPFGEKVVLASSFGKLIIVDLSSKEGELTPTIDKEIHLKNFGVLKVENDLLVIAPDGWHRLNLQGKKLSSGALPVQDISKIQTVSDLTGDSFWVCYKDQKRVDYCEKWTIQNGQLRSSKSKFKSGFGINTVFRAKDGIDWFGGDEGIIRYDDAFEFKSQDESIACHISSTLVNGDSLVSHYGLKPNGLNLPYENNSIQFKFYSDQSFSSTGDILFQYQLEGLDKGWSTWSGQTSKEYSNLNPNEYTFNVRARNSFGKVSDIESISFEITTPWYLSTFGFLTYILVAILAIFGYVQWRTTNLEQAKKQLEDLVKGRTNEVERQKQSLEEQSETLRQANATKDQLFSIIGHDLRGPLGSIQGLTGLIKHYRSEQKPEEVDELMEHMSDSVKGLSHLLDNLLSWTLNQSGNFELKKENVHLLSLVTEVVGVLKETAVSKDINIAIQVDEKIFLEADTNSLGTVLRNLVGNAIKFTHRNGNIWIRAINKQDHLMIEIKDDGIGIPEDKMTEIFQLAKSTHGTANEKGTGLGLTLVEDFVTLNGGTMTLNSKVGEGTCFELTFPLSQPHSA